MNRVIFSVLFLACILMSSLVQAHPSISGETGLFGIISSDSMEQGDYSFSFYLNNYDRELGTSKDSMDLDITMASASFFYAVTSRIEVGFNVNYIDLYSREEGENGSFQGEDFFNRIDESGFGDVHVGVKFTILNSLDNVVGLGVMAFAKLPTADEDKGLGTGETDYGLRMLLTKPLEPMTIHANVGYTIVGEPDEADFDNVLDYGVGVNFPNDRHVGNFLQYIAELTGGTQPDADLPEYLDLTMGVRYHFTKQFYPDQPVYRNGWALSAGIRYNLMMEFDDCPIGGLLGLSFMPPFVPPPPAPAAQPPKILGIDGIGDSINACETMDLKVNAVDPDNDIAEYRWAVSCGTIVGSGPSVKWEAPCPCTDETPKTCTVSCTVMDGKGQSDMINYTVAIVCPPPASKEEPQAPTFENVFFAPGSSRVDNIAKAVLDEIARQMKNDKRLYVIIQGHSDNRGPEKQNMNIGLQRAKNVKEYLVKMHNIDPNRLETLSLGSSKPIGDNNTADGRAKNRRVDFLVEIR